MASMDEQHCIPHVNFTSDLQNGNGPRKVKISLDDAFLKMMIRKVDDYRPIADFSTDWTSEGPPTHLMTSLAKYWSSTYDWRAVEKRMNEQFDHYTAVVPGNGRYSQPIPLHFVHQQSERKDAIPLLLLHGWPSSFMEWSKVIEPLTKDFHVVAPDLPGFGLSPPPKQAGLGPVEMARAFDALMHQLGYDEYGIVTTDLGWFAGMWMVSEAAPSIIGHMSDFYIAPPSDEDRDRLRQGNATVKETAYMAAYDDWFHSHWGYAMIHGQKPLALSLALTDSPVGFLGWYLDVNHATSDGFEYDFETLITDTIMLWIPGPYANTRAYLEWFQPDIMNFPASTVPTGVSEWGWGNGPFPGIGDFAFVPKEWIKRTANLVYFEEHERGGHFPAVSMPELWVSDVQKFFLPLHKSRKNR